MILYNYSVIKNRESRIYNVGGYNISGGLSVEFIKVVGPCIILGIILGVIIGLPFHFSFFNPFSDNFHLKWTLFWIILGAGIGCGLWYIQFAGYRLYQYLLAYFKPKKVYINDSKNTQFKLTNVKFKGFVKNIL